MEGETVDADEVITDLDGDVIRVPKSAYDDTAGESRGPTQVRVYKGSDPTEKGTPLCVLRQTEVGRLQEDADKMTPTILGRPRSGIIIAHNINEGSLQVRNVDSTICGMLSGNEGRHSFATEVGA